MIYCIENNYLKVCISDKGAEMNSVKNKFDGYEYLWQGDEKYWTGRSPIMFPICGRLFEGKYTYLGKTYEMKNHGFARHSVFSLKSASQSEITLSLVSDEETKKVYPFDFVFDVSYILSQKEITVKYRVRNKDTKEMIFALGGHPAFNVPIGNEGVFEDYRVEFGHKCDAFRVDLTDTGFCTHNDKLYKSGGVKTIPLTHSMFDNDAIFLYNTDKTVTLCSDKSARKITLFFNDMKYIGLWHTNKSDAPFLCIEPWTSVPAMNGKTDDLITKEQMIHLPSEYTFSASYRIALE